MRSIRSIDLAALSLVMMAACTDATPATSPLTAAATATSTVTTAPGLTADEAETLARIEGWEGGAFVLNPGAGKPDGFCFYQGGTYFASRVTVVRSPSGNWTLSCSFENLPEIADQETTTGWLCSIIGAPGDQTRQTSWVRTTSGRAHLTCQFSGKPVQNATVSWGDVSSPAQEASFTQPLAELPGKQLTGETAVVGLACAPIAADLTGRVAIIERGVCAFDAKVRNAMNAGAAAAIVYNSAPFGDQIIVMGGVTTVGIPAVFVGRSTGLSLRSASPTEVTITSCARSASCRGDL